MCRAPAGNVADSSNTSHRIKYRTSERKNSTAACEQGKSKSKSKSKTKNQPRGVTGDPKHNKKRQQ